MLNTLFKTIRQQNKSTTKQSKYLSDPHRDSNPDLVLRWYGSIRLSYGGGVKLDTSLISVGINLSDCAIISILFIWKYKYKNITLKLKVLSNYSI